MLSGPVPPSPATSVGFASRGHSPSTSVGRGGHFAALLPFFFLVRQEGRGKRRGPRARPPRRKQKEKPRHDCTRQAIRSRPPPAPPFAGARQRKSAGSSLAPGKASFLPFLAFSNMTVPLPV